MNKNLKAVYYCYTSQRNWGKGYTMKEAEKNAKLIASKMEYCTLVAVFNNPDDDELENLFDCITSDEVFGSPKFYDFDRKIEDTEMINKYFIGWLILNKK